MTPIRGGTTVERDPFGSNRSVSVVTDEDGNGAVWIDGVYAGGIYRFAETDEADDQWIVYPRDVNGALDERFELGCEAVEALLAWHFENRERCEILAEEWEDG